MHQRENDRTISFRLGGRSLAELDRQAKALGTSAGALGRAIVLRHLTRDDARAILDAIEGQGLRHEALARGFEERLSGLQEELTGLRNDFNRALRGK